MALTKLSTSMDNVQGLADLVQNQATTVKQTMDKAGNDIKTYVNDTLTAEQDTINTDLDSRLTTAEGEIDALQTADGQNVKLTGNQTVAGIKTFSSSPIVPEPTTDTQASTKKYVDDENAKDVHLIGDQTVAGVKTFSSSPIVPTPTTSTQASSKGYVDTAIAGVVMGQVPDNSLTTAKYQDGSVTAAKCAADVATQSELEDLSGAGRTTETVKGNADNLATHVADNTAHVPHIGTTTNSGNDYSVTSTKVIADGSKFSVKFNAIASGTATLNISSDGTGRTLKKPDGTDFKPKAGIYSFIRDGVNFQLLGEGGEYGTAGAGDVRSTKTLGTENGVISGTLDLSNVQAGNIKNGVVIAGVTGTYVFTFTPADASIAGTSTETSTTSMTLVKLREFRVNYPGTVRVKFQLRSSLATKFAIGQTYINGVAVGSTWSNDTTTNVTYTEDFVVNTNDLIQIYCRMGNSGGHTCYLASVNICTIALATQTL